MHWEADSQEIALITFPGSALDDVQAVPPAKGLIDVSISPFVSPAAHWPTEEHDSAVSPTGAENGG